MTKAVTVTVSIVDSETGKSVIEFDRDISYEGDLADAVAFAYDDFRHRGMDMDSLFDRYVVSVKKTENIDLPVGFRDGRLSSPAKKREA